MHMFYWGCTFFRKKTPEASYISRTGFVFMYLFIYIYIYIYMSAGRVSSRTYFFLGVLVGDMAQVGRSSSRRPQKVTFRKNKSGFPFSFDFSWPPDCADRSVSSRRYGRNSPAALGCLPDPKYQKYV